MAAPGIGNILTTRGGQKMRTVSLLTVLAVFLISPIRAEETIADESHGFRLQLPDGYAPNPELVAANPGVIHAFMTRDTDEDGNRIVLIIQGLKKTIGPQHIKAEQMPAGFKGRIFTMKWQGFDRDVSEVPEEFNGTPTLTFNVMIPLKQAAIQLKLFGAAKRKAELQSDLQQIVRGLEGETNWIPVASQVAAKMSPENDGNVLLAFAITFVAVGLVALYVLSRFMPKGSVLAIAAVIYIASWSFEGVKVREILMLTGSMRLLGFAGGILGVVDLLRKRPACAAGAAGQSPFEKPKP